MEDGLVVKRFCCFFIRKSLRVVGRYGRCSGGAGYEGCRWAFLYSYSYSSTAFSADGVSKKGFWVSGDRRAYSFWFTGLSSVSYL